jgi:hypothetical protein
LIEITFRCQDIAAQAIADRPSHDRLGGVADGLLGIAYLKKKEDRVFNTVLDDSLNIDDVEITCQHQ